MIPFAVWHEGITEGSGRWVLAVDAKSNDLLLANDDGEFYWKPIQDCKLIRVQTPDNPIAVWPMQPQQQPNIVFPSSNGFGLVRKYRCP